MKLNTIIIIGTEPPCPRCGLLLNIIEERIKELKINSAIVRHFAYDTDEAAEIAAFHGLTPGTAKNVATILGEKIDASALENIIQKESTDYRHEFHVYNKHRWSPALDQFLRPYELKSQELGIMMTPVLVINVSIIHQGSLPKLASIDKWLYELPVI